MNPVKISETQYQIPKQGKMKVPGIIFADENLISCIKQDKTLEQVKNVAMLPGIIKASFAMPDAHQGYGFPIGGVAAFDINSGIISPGGVGYDINCGVRVLATNLTIEDLKSNKKKILNQLFRDIPSGVGKKGRIKLTDNELDAVLINGSQWAVEKGYGEKDDYLHTEDQGKISNANPKDVSQRARARGKPQLGSLGAGNHFLEVQKVEEIFDEKTAQAFGLKKGQITIMIHCGSRGLGHQVASDYIKLMEQEYGFPPQDHELVNAPIKSELGKKYLSAMACSANFAFANRQLITHWVREAMKRIFPNFKASVIYDVCHNIAKFETHQINNKPKKVLIMRKGATRALPPNHPLLPTAYKKTGQPVLIPGSMGTSSYILIGIPNSPAFASTAHGAGRLESRTQARQTLNAEKIKKELEEKGIQIKAGSFKGIVEEAPEVYKDIDEVIKVSEKAGLAKPVARVKPILVIKG